MKTIWKYEIAGTGSQIIIPKIHRFLTVQGQNNNICLWAEVETESPNEQVYIEVFGTDQEIPENMGTMREYLGTAQIYDGKLVWHVYKWTGI